jgi:RNA 2',3'-cyclic 3'-phosphodiesterase
MEPLRLFTALLPPPVVRAELAALAAPLPEIRWVPEENLHLTLRFLGDCDADRRARFEEALARVRVEPFILPVAGVGLFPSRGPAKVLWAGTGRSHTRLFQLRKQVDEALLSAEPGLDVHSFHPHFTLGRLGAAYDARALAAWLERYRDWEAPPFRVDTFQLMASEAAPGHPPVYRSVRAYALAD